MSYLSIRISEQRLPVIIVPAYGVSMAVHIAKQGKVTPWETKQLERIVRHDPAEDIWLSIDRDDIMASRQQV